MIVGVTGRAQHGKDTVGQRLVERFGFEQFGFASALKELALRVNPYVPLGHPYPTVFMQLTDVVRDYGWERAKQTKEVRRVLQELGTGVRDTVGQASWVRALSVELLEKRPSRAVITDLRFPNEADFIRESGGWLLRVTRPDFNNGVDPSHPSEAAVAGLHVDFELVNSGSIEQLHELVDDFFECVVLNG